MENSVQSNLSNLNCSVVVPVYNEELNIDPFVSRIESTFKSNGLTYELIFVLDPSRDKTEEVILRNIKRNPSIKLLVLSRRFGQPAATMAGLVASSGDTCVVIDVDQQDPPELISEMYKKFRDGYEVVYAKRRSRRGETAIKKVIASAGYWAMEKLSDLNIPRDTGDFRMMSRRVVDHVIELSDTAGFLRGLVAYVGFKQTFIEYDREERRFGSGNYSRLTGSIKIGLNGIIGFSARPLFLMSLCGLVLAIFSFILGAWYVIQKLMGFELSPGLSTTVLVVTFFSGVQLLGLGLIGEYIGRIYDEVKGRPHFIVDKKINF